MDLFNKPKDIIQSENVIQCMKPWYQICRFFGIGPFQIRENKVGQHKLFLSWTIIFTFLFYINFAYVFISYFPNVNENNIRRLINLVDYVSYPSLAICFVTAHLLQTKKSFRILEELIKIDKKFQSINVNFTYKKIQKHLLIYLFIGLLWAILMHSVLFPILTSLKRSHVPVHLYVYWLTLEVNRISFLVKSSAILKIMKVRFSTVNSQIASLSDDRMEPHELSFSCNTQLFGKKMMKSYDCHDKIRKLRWIHERLSDVCELLNAVEEIPILFALGNLFVLIIINVFYTFNAWYNHGEDIVVTFANTLIVIVHSFGTGIFLVPQLTDISKEANRTGVTIHRIIGKITDNGARKELKLFSNQLLHRKVLFSAKGFFPLDYSLISSVAGSITTYLVILIQFQTLSPRAKQNSTGFALD